MSDLESCVAALFLGMDNGMGDEIECDSKDAGCSRLWWFDLFLS